jgi:hypothetical protein
MFQRTNLRPQMTIFISLHSVAFAAHRPAINKRVFSGFQLGQG